MHPNNVEIDGIILTILLSYGVDKEIVTPIGITNKTTLFGFLSGFSK